MSVHEKAEMYYQTTVKISTSLQAITARKQQDKDILEWIWPERQVYSLPKKPDEDNVENSGDWFLASHEYKQWVSQGSTTLICYGQRNFSQFPWLVNTQTDFSSRLWEIPSLVNPLNNTVWLISSVIYNKLWDTPQIGLCSFLFKISDLQQTAENVVRIALRQLVEEFEDLPQSVYSAYTLAQKNDRGRSPSLNIATKLLNTCISDFFKTYSNPIFILLDAFDEFMNKREQDRQRDVLLSSLAGLCSEGHVKLLFTTRPQYRGQLQEKFHDSKAIEVKTDQNDVNKYLDLELKSSDLSDDLKKSIKSTIAAQAGDIP